MNRKITKNIRFFTIKHCFALAVILLFQSCSAVYQKPLLTKAYIENESEEVSSSELSKFIRQKPNKKILKIFPFHLKVYQLAEKLPDKQKKKKEKIDKKITSKQASQKVVDFGKMEKKKQRTLRTWLMQTIGEAPIYLDSTLINTSKNQMALYLKSNGFFESQIDYEVKYLKNQQKAKVKYIVKAGKQHNINNVEWDIQDKAIRHIINKNINESPIKKGIAYNEDLFDTERDKITDILRNNGYYHFSKSYIVFEAYSSIGNHLIDLKIIIKPYLIETNKENKIFTEAQHPRSLINDIYFYPNYSLKYSNIISSDTSMIVYKRRKQTKHNSCYFVYNEAFRVKPQVLIEKLFVHKNDLFKNNQAIATHNALLGLMNYRSINMIFKENEPKYIYYNNFLVPNLNKCFYQFGVDSIYLQTLDMHIHLSQAELQSLTTELETTHSAGNLGVSGYLTYKNKSIFKGAEILSFRLKGALEVQHAISESKETQAKASSLQKLPFNTIETGFESQLAVPRFLLPYANKLFTQKNEPTTSFSLGIFFQERPDYIRYISNVSISYDWNESKLKRHSISPFLNLVNITPDSSFAARIEQLSKPLQTSYKNHLINGLKYTYTFSNQSVEKNYSFIRTNIESAGFVNRLGAVYFAGAKSQQTYHIFGIRFAQYIKGDMDYRTYFQFSSKQSLVIRQFFGIGVPYGNIDVLPFDKRYSAGGSNDIRAWKYRSLGPGAYSDNLLFDKTGDISYIGNIEYRFPIYSLLHSAIFIDYGNVWTLKKYEDFPGGHFSISDFYKQLAVGTGLGLRLNFGFFIIRFDIGLPLYDPSLDESNRWLGLNEARKQSNVNFGIGYPF